MKSVAYKVCPRCKGENGINCTEANGHWHENIISVPHSSIIECAKFALQPSYKHTVPIELRDVRLPPTLEQCIKQKTHSTSNLCIVCNQ